MHLVIRLSILSIDCIYIQHSQTQSRIRLLFGSINRIKQIYLYVYISFQCFLEAVLLKSVFFSCQYLIRWTKGWKKLYSCIWNIIYYSALESDLSQCLIHQGNLCYIRYISWIKTSVSFRMMTCFYKLSFTSFLKENLTQFYVCLFFFVCFFFKPVTTRKKI